MQDAQPSSLTPEESKAKRRNALVVAIAYTACALLYKFVFAEGLGHTSLIFIGLPGVLAILLSFAPRVTTAKGGIVKGITFALLLVAPLLGEGYLCILMASPLFYAIGLAVGAGMDYRRNKITLRLSSITVVLVLLSLEGVVPALTYDRSESVTVTETIDATADQVEAALAQSPDLTTPMPRFLRIGFPRPLSAHGEGLDLDATRIIRFTGAEGDPPGDLTMRVTERSSNRVVFTSVGDTSKLAQWVRWESSDVVWQQIDPTHTRVAWTTSFSRQLDPWWYFAPWERYAVRDATEYLIRANVTPTELRHTPTR